MNIHALSHITKPKELFFCFAFPLTLSHCLQGYGYQTVSGKCCGTCIQNSCIFTTPDQTTHVIEVSAAAGVSSHFKANNMRNGMWL